MSPYNTLRTVNYDYLIVVGEGDDAGADAEKHARVNFTMSIHVGCRIYLRLQPLIWREDIVPVERIR